MVIPVSEQTVAAVAEVFATMGPHLDERRRRLPLGASARALGRGGIGAVAAATGAAAPTVSAGVRDLDGGVGVGFNNPAEALTWAYAAASYSLMRPPRIFVRAIRWAGNGMTSGSSRGARRLSPWP